MPESNQTPTLPPGWRLVNRTDRPMIITLLFNRQESDRHWVVATGRSFDEALANGLRRMQLYDESERGRRAPK